MRPWDLSFPPSLEETWRDFMKKRVKAIKQKCSSTALFLPKAPVARTMVPSQPGRGDLGPPTPLQVPQHPLAILPTAAPSAGRAARTRPVEDSW